MDSKAQQTFGENYYCCRCHRIKLIHCWKQNWCSWKTKTRQLTQRRKTIGSNEHHHHSISLHSKRRRKRNLKWLEQLERQKALQVHWPCMGFKTFQNCQRRWSFHHLPRKNCKDWRINWSCSNPNQQTTRHWGLEIKNWAEQQEQRQKRCKCYCFIICFCFPHLIDLNKKIIISLFE